MSTEHDSMACNELVERITAYLDGALDLETRARLDIHLVECPGCGNYLQQLHTTMGTLRKMSDADLDPAFRGRLLNIFKKAE